MFIELLGRREGMFPKLLFAFFSFFSIQTNDAAFLHVHLCSAVLVLAAQVAVNDGGRPAGRLVGWLLIDKQLMASSLLAIHVTKIDATG